MTRHVMESCDWCEDWTPSREHVDANNPLPEGWQRARVPTPFDGGHFRTGAGRAVFEHDRPVLCPDCLGAHAKAVRALDEFARTTFEEAIAGQRRPRTQGRGHSKAWLKGRDS